ERTLAPAFRELVAGAPGRVIVATFASHVHRIQQVADAAAACGRRFVLEGRSVVSVAGTAMQLGELRIPSSLLVEASELRELPPERVVVVTTGSQGEPLAALSRIALDDHRRIAVGPGDRVAISARVIPGHERAVARTVNHLVRRGAEVRYGRDAGIHVSGHGAAGELAEIVRTVRPRHVVPVHGEPRHLAALSRVAADAGVAPERTLVVANGERLRCEAGALRRAGTQAAGRTLVDGSGLGAPQDAVLRDRRRLAQDGFVLVLVGISRQSGELLAGPEVLTRGVAFSGEEAPLIEEARAAVTEVLAGCGPELRADWSEVQARIHAALRRLVSRRMERRPLILPTVIEI
ncbi:MAG: ribonuclease J, partial [Synechococcaceae cyanobacterium]|nr:ribonuclease J [Synechococcaceae cyanobacterium]